jgi:zinc transporter
MTGFGYHIAEDGTAERTDPVQALESDAHLVWVHWPTTDEAAEAFFRDHGKLEDYVIDALTAFETRPRCEAFGHGALLNLRGRSEETLATSDPLASIRIWAVKGRVYSASRSTLVAVNEVEKLAQAGDLHDPGDLITAFATAITSDLDPVVADLGDEVDACEEQLDVENVFELRRTVTRVRVQAIGFRRFLNPQRAALEKLAALPGDWLGDDDRLHLSAAADRAARMAEELDAIRERSALTHEALTDLRAEQLDTRSLVISIAAMVFLPLTFLTGLYGMNVKGLPYAEEPWAFDAIMGACALIAAGIVIYFVQRHWFRR